MPGAGIALLAAAAIAAPAVGWRLAGAGRTRRAARAAYFDALAPLFQSVCTQLQPTGLPRMTGLRDGLSFDLQALPDSLTFRKLPALWVMVSLPEPLPLAATLDAMARPSGGEPFSRFASLPHLLQPPPESLPGTVAVRTENAAAVPPADLLADHAGLFDDPAVKELLISPRGLRIVFLAEEADRGRYLLFRDAEMARHPLDPGRVVPHLDRLARLRDQVLALARHAA